jgi:hypothetical protein
MRLKTHLACAVLGEVVNVWYFKHLQTLPVPGASLDSLSHASVRLLVRITMAAWQVYLLNRPSKVQAATNRKAVDNKEELLQEQRNHGEDAGGSSGVTTKKLIEVDAVFSSELQMQQLLQPSLQTSNRPSGGGLRLRGGASGVAASQQQQELEGAEQQHEQNALHSLMADYHQPGGLTSSASPVPAPLAGSCKVGTEPSSPSMRHQAWADGGVLSEATTDGAGGVMSSSYCRWVGA